MAQTRHRTEHQDQEPRRSRRRIGLQGCVVGLASTVVLVTMTLAGTGTAGATTSFSADNGTFTGVSCWSASSCVAVGSNTVNISTTEALVATSSDGGANWTTQSIAMLANLIPQDVSCPAAGICFMVAIGTTAGGGSSVLKSTDGGQSWSLVAGPSAFGGNLSLAHITCATSSSCVALGAGGYSDEPWFTTDGGATWTEHQIPGIYEYTVESVSCWSAGNCLLVGQPTFLQSWDQAVVFSTTNNGVTWVPETAPTYNLHTVACYGPSTCAATGLSVSGAGQISTTTNGGASWTTVTPPAASNAANRGFFVISCSSSVCAAGLGDTLLVGQGTSWDSRTLPSPMTVLSSTGCAPSANNCALGGRGAITAPVGGLLGVTAPVASTTAESSTKPGGQVPCSPPAGAGGYWEVASDGGIFNFGGAPFCGSMGGAALNRPVVGIAGTPDGGGYWEVATDGGIFSFGDAAFYGSTGAITLNQPIIGLASTADGRGYWLVARDGGIFAFGDAQFYGSMGATHLNQPIVGMAATPDGKGYWMVASDGGVFSFGDAAFYGSMGATHLNRPVVGIASTPRGNGYWMVASDGGIFNFGDAAFAGSMGGTPLNAPVVGISVSTSGQGYREVATDGGIFSFGGAAFAGSMGGTPLNAPVVGIAGD